MGIWQPLGIDFICSDVGEQDIEDKDRGAYCPKGGQGGACCPKGHPLVLRPPVGRRGWFIRHYSLREAVKIKS